MLLRNGELCVFVSRCGYAPTSAAGNSAPVMRAGGTKYTHTHVVVFVVVVLFLDFRSSHLSSLENEKRRAKWVNLVVTLKMSSISSSTRRLQRTSSESNKFKSSCVFFLTPPADEQKEGEEEEEDVRMKTHTCVIWNVTHFEGFVSFNSLNVDDFFSNFKNPLFHSV